MTAPDNPIAPESPDRLDSWKEIANYFGRTERTVRRWEESLGLPVHRLAHEKRNSVYAYRAELDAWRESRKRDLDAAGVTTDSEPSATDATATTEITPTRRLPIWLVAGAALALLVGALATWLVVRTRSNQLHLTSIAVLPFDNLSHDPQQEWFSDGMTEILITELSKIRSLKVISRTSVKQYKGVAKNTRQIANELGVDAIVEGSALRVGDRVRITAQLIATDSDTHLWGRDFDGEMKDVLSLQRDVARAIAGEVGAEVAADDGQRAAVRIDSVDPQAMSSYLTALNLYHRNDFRRAADLAREATRRAPRFAAAYELLGIILETMADYHAAAYAAILPEAQAALQRAIALEPDRGVALGWLGATYFFGLHDWVSAEQYLRRGFELNPADGNNLGLFLAAQGKYREATAAVDRALQVDPFSPDLLGDAGRVYELARRYDESARFYVKALELNPGAGIAPFFLPVTLILAGRPDEAFERFYVVRDARGPLGRGPEFRKMYETGGWPMVWQAWLDGHARGSLDEYSRWARILLHQDDETLDMLERLEQMNDSWMVQLEDPVYDHLRHHPRFQAILKRVGYPANMLQ